MIHEDVNQNEVTIEVEQQNQKPYSAAHATRKKVRQNSIDRAGMSDQRGNMLSKQSTNFTGGVNPPQNLKMGDSYGFKSNQ